MRKLAIIHLLTGFVMSVQVYGQQTLRSARHVHHKEHLHHEINQLDKNIEKLLDSAAKHMITFILEKQLKEFETAMDLVSQADNLNKKVEDLAAKEHGYGLKVEQSVIEDRKEEIFSYYQNDAKAIVLNTRSKICSEKIKFRGKSFKVSRESAALFEIYIDYLPKN
jgi:hypothetical protein